MNHWVATIAGRRAWLNMAMVAGFLLAVGAMSWRLERHWPCAGRPDAEHWALASFRDVVYYPLRAVDDGVNPYDTTRGDPARYLERYDALDTLPLYSPLMLVLYAPLAAWPLDASLVAMSVVNLALFACLAVLAIRVAGRRPTFAAVVALATLLLISQPGRGVFFSGQFALPLALAAIAAVDLGDRRPWLGGAMVALAVCKPSYGGPLGLLLTARRDWRSGLGGLAAGAGVAVLGMTAIFARAGVTSPSAAFAVVAANQSNFAHNPTVVAHTNRGRIDLAAVIEYLINQPLPAWTGAAVAIAVLGLTAAILWRAGFKSERLAASAAGRCFWWRC